MDLTCLGRLGSVAKILLISQSNGIVRKGTLQADMFSTFTKEKGNKQIHKGKLRKDL